MAYQPIEIISRTRWLPHLSIICTLIFLVQGAGNAQLPAGRVASHGIERDAVNADGTGEGVGYFTFIAGVPGPLFAGSPSEATAFFTFRSDPFSTEVIPNGTVTALLHPPGRLTIYLNKAPHGNWNNFDTFSEGQPIAVLEFGITQDINDGSVQIGYTSARFAASSDFEFQGQRLNFTNLFPNGVTIAFTTNPRPLNASFPLIFALGFSSFAIGAETEQTENVTQK